MIFKRLAIPLVVLLVIAGALLVLVNEGTHTRKIRADGQVVAEPAPPQSQVDAAAKAAAGEFRSLDKVNAAAKAVGCQTLELGDPAGKLIDVAECLGEKARRGLPGGQPGGIKPR